MVRTKGDSSNVRASGAKAPRKILATRSSSASSQNKGGGGGNPYCPRETPEWQKEITKFFNPVSEKPKETNGEASTTGSEDAEDAKICSEEMTKTEINID